MKTLCRSIAKTHTNVIYRNQFNSKNILFVHKLHVHICICIWDAWHRLINSVTRRGTQEASHCRDSHCKLQSGSEFSTIIVLV